METNKLIAGIVAAAIAIIVLAGVLMPALSNATTTHETFTNDGVFNYGVFKPGDDYTMTLDNTTGLSVNGESLSIPGISPDRVSDRYSVIATDNVLVRFGSAVGNYLSQIVGTNDQGNSVSPGPQSMTATIIDDKLNIVWINNSDVETTYNFDFDELYAVVPNEDIAVMKVSNSTVYIKGDSEIYGSGLTTVSAWSNMFHLEGTYDDGITISSPNLTTATFDNIKWNIEPVDGYIDLYKLTSIEFDITNSGTTVHATYSYFGVPSEVTAERSVHLSDAMNTILSVIPLLIIVAVLLAVVALMVIRRN